MPDEEMKEERFVLFDTQIFFSPINKNKFNYKNSHGIARSYSVATFGVTTKTIKINTQ